MQTKIEEALNKAGSKENRLVVDNIRKNRHTQSICRSRKHIFKTRWLHTHENICIRLALHLTYDRIWP